MCSLRPLLLGRLFVWQLYQLLVLPEPWIPPSDHFFQWTRFGPEIYSLPRMRIGNEEKVYHIQQWCSGKRLNGRPQRCPSPTSNLFPFVVPRQNMVRPRTIRTIKVVCTPTEGGKSHETRFTWQTHPVQGRLDLSSPLDKKTFERLVSYGYCIDGGLTTIVIQFTKKESKPDTTMTTTTI